MTFSDLRQLASRLISRLLSRLLTIAILILYGVPTSTYAVDDDLLAHRLYQQGDYAQAAEIFTDPAWKGVALYRSSQWWRAAEAFVRANDAQSAFNLGNCYVKLGYYALALDAYQRALSIDPDLVDAKVNSDIMRALLKKNDDKNSEQGGRQSSGDEIESIENDDEREAGAGKGGQDSDSTGESAPGGSSNTGDESGNAADKAEAGDGSAASERDSTREGQDGSGAVNGQEANRDNRSQPSGGSESDQVSDASQAAGLRAELESEQATEQWLNRIQHDPQRYLAKRIKLEERRRRAVGQSAPEGGSAW